MERRALTGYVGLSANMVKSAPKCCCDIAHKWRELSSVFSNEFIKRVFAKLSQESREEREKRLKIIRDNKASR